jgi:hypothetical protein
MGIGKGEGQAKYLLPHLSDFWRRIKVKKRMRNYTTYECCN